jgi:hypothetical protein
VVDGWLQQFAKASETDKGEVVMQVGVTPADIDIKDAISRCQNSNVTYDIYGVLKEDGDNDEITLKGYEIKLDLDTDLVIEKERHLYDNIGSFEDKDNDKYLPNIEDGLVRAYVSQDDATFEEEDNETLFTVILTKKYDSSNEEYEDTANCVMQYIGEADDKANVMEEVSFHDDDEFKDYISNMIEKVYDLDEDEFLDAFEELADELDVDELDDMDVKDVKDVKDVRDVRDAFLKVVEDSENNDDILVFMSTFFGELDEDVLEDLAKVYKNKTKRVFTVRVNETKSSMYWLKDDTVNNEFVLEEMEVEFIEEDEEDEEGGSRSGGQYSGGSSNDSGSSSNNEYDEDRNYNGDNDNGDSRYDNNRDGDNTDGDSQYSGSSSPGVGRNYECVDRSGEEYYSIESQVCGCEGEDCGFNSGEDDAYDWRCCYRDWGPCEADGRQACITKFDNEWKERRVTGQGGTQHRCDVGAVQTCEGSQLNDVINIDEGDDYSCAGFPDNLPEPADGAGRPGCFFKDGYSNWITCQNNGECENIGGTWCYAGYCGK